MKTTIADEILEWIMTNIIPWVLIAGLVALLVMVLVSMVWTFYSGHKTESEEGSVNTGYVIGKYHSPRHFVGIIGKGGHYVPEKWIVVIGGRRPVSGRFDTCEYAVTESCFNRITEGQAINFEP